MFRVFYQMAVGRTRHFRRRPLQRLQSGTRHLCSQLARYNVRRTTRLNTKLRRSIATYQASHPACPNKTQTAVKNFKCRILARIQLKRSSSGRRGKELRLNKPSSNNRQGRQARLSVRGKSPIQVLKLKMSRRQLRNYCKRGRAMAQTQILKS